MIAALITLIAEETPGADQGGVLLDPTLVVLLPLIGVVVTVGVGLIGAWIQGRREHTKWIRQQRYGAFEGAIVLLRQVAALMDQAKALLANGATPGPEFAAISAGAKQLRDEWPRASAPLALLGPDEVDDALGAAALALPSDDPEVIRTAEEKLIAVMRKSLGVRA